MTMLTIKLTRISQARHRFECIRENGTRESAELETKTFLEHDLTHFAVESEAHLTDSFYGQLLSGQSYAELSARRMEAATQTEGKEIMMTERVVGVMTGVLLGDAAPSAALAALDNLLRASGEAVPQWFTEEYVTRVKERMRRLTGEWNGTPFGQTMALEFTAPRSD